MRWGPWPQPGPARPGGDRSRGRLAPSAQGRVQGPGSKAGPTYLPHSGVAPEPGRQPHATQPVALPVSRPVASGRGSRAGVATCVCVYRCVCRCSVDACTAAVGGSALNSETALAEPAAHLRDTLHGAAGVRSGRGSSGGGEGVGWGRRAVRSSDTK